MIKILSSKSYEDTSKNYGDCIIGIDGQTAIIFDCGSEEHAKKAIKILDETALTRQLLSSPTTMMTISKAFHTSLTKDE